MREIKNYKALFISLIAFAVSTVPTLSFAEIEEVIVTAQKREQNAQDIGVSVNVFSAEQLDRAGIQDVSRLQLITPGLAFAQRGNDFKLTLRGANAENTDRDEPTPVGVFVDGLFRLRAAQAGNAFLDVGSVEVLKGPQGTLFGRNNLGGAILIKTNKPDTAKNSYAFNVTGGEYNLVKSEGFFNMAVNDQLAIRFAGSYADADGYIENLGASNDLGEVEDVTTRLSALWDINNDFNALLSYFRYDSGGSALGAYGYQSRGTLRDPDPTSAIPINERETHANGIHDPRNSRGGSLGTRADRGPHEIYRDSPFIRDVTEDTFALELNYDVGGFSVKSLNAYTDYYNLALVDGDYSEGRLLEEARLDDMQAYSQELQITSKSEGDLEWVGGLIYAYEEYDQAFFRNWLGFAGTAAEKDLVEARTLDINSLANCANAFSPQATAAIADPDDPNANCAGQFSGNPTSLESHSFGVYAHGTYSFTDRARLNAGLRYSRDQKDFRGGRILRSTGTIGETTVTGADSSRDDSWSKVTWKVGGELDVFDDDHLAYANISTGYLTGGFNPNGTTFDQQEVLSYEIGLKNRFLNDRVELNISVYRNEFDELLAGVLDAQSITQKVNGGSLTANGVEIDIKTLVTERLYAYGNLSFQDATYDEYSANNRFQLVGDNPLDANGNISLNGKKAPWAPSVSGSFSLSYDIPTTLGKFTAHFQTSFFGSHYTTGLQQFDLAKQEAYAKADIRLYWKSATTPWAAKAYVENISDYAVLEHTIVGGSDIIQVSYGKPRMAGFTLSYLFD